MILLDDIPVGVRVGLDTAPLIYQVEDHPVYKPVIEPLFRDRLEKGHNEAVTSTVSLAEVLVHPLPLKRNDLVTRYRDLLTATSYMSVVTDLRVLVLQDYLPSAGP